jgi:hypothetical protein
MRIARVLKAKDVREGDRVLADDGRWMKVEEVTQSYSESFDQKKKAGVWVRLDAFEPEYLGRKERVVVLR